MVAGTATGGIRELFTGLLPAEVIDAYDRLLAQDGCPKDDAEELVGTGLVDALTHWGMAHIQPHTPADPAWLQPASPDLALQGVLAGHQHRLARDQELLLDGHRRLASAQARYGIGVTGAGKLPEHLITVFAQPPLPAARGLARCRTIYPAPAMNDPTARQIMQACAAAGEEVRLLPRVAMKLKLADTTTAVLPLAGDGTAATLIIRAKAINVALRDYFELLWERATPLQTAREAPAGDRLAPAQQKVLELMAEGLNDDAIARRLSISTTTVRRHATEITQRLGVSSRFAAGAAALRRGWIR